MEYDFKNLSSYDLELLCRDLLQKILVLNLESFKSGRDKGIDLRYSKDKNNTLVVQCKHYAGSTISNLIGTLKSEIEKVRKLNPDRYILCTSLSLGVGDKEKIEGIMSPYIKDRSDIIGKEDLNNFLNLHKDIEQQHYKLWLTRTSILKNIVHSDILNKSRFLTHSILEKAPLYVQNDSYPKAINILKEQRSCIISGVPGIGKTTLAEMLLLYHANLEYEVVALSEISQGFRYFDPTKRQIFFYDDFLGQTFFGDSRQNHETNEIMSFISKISKEKNHRFLMTTREYILMQAHILNEKIGTSDISVRKCVVDIEVYTKRVRSKILLNHLYFSTMPKEFIAEIVKESRFLTIVKHKNFNPRIIEWMTSTTKLQGVDPGNYFKRFIAYLDNPSELWRYSFDKLTIEAQILVLALGSLQGEVLSTDLQKVFNSTYDLFSKYFNVPKKPNAYLNSLKETEGTFIISNKFYDERIIKFHSPSVRDFINSYLPTSDEYQKVLLESALSFDQIRGIIEINNAGLPEANKCIKLPIENGKITQILKTDWGSSLIKTLRYQHHSGCSPEYVIPYWLELAKKDSIKELIRPQVEILKERLQNQRCQVKQLAICIESLEKQPQYYFGMRNDIFDLAKIAIKENLNDIRQIEAACDFKVKFSGIFSQGEVNAFDEAIYLAIDSDVRYTIGDEVDPFELESYIDRLKMISDEYQFDLTENIKDVSNWKREIERESRHEEDFEKDDVYSGQNYEPEDIQDEEIISMFDCLVED